MLSVGIGWYKPQFADLSTVAVYLVYLPVCSLHLSFTEFVATNPVNFSEIDLVKLPKTAYLLAFLKNFHHIDFLQRTVPVWNVIMLITTSVLIFRRTVMSLIFLEESGYQCSPIVREWHRRELRLRCAGYWISDELNSCKIYCCWLHQAL